MDSKNIRIAEKHDITKIRCHTEFIPLKPMYSPISEVPRAPPVAELKLPKALNRAL